MKKFKQKKGIALAIALLTVAVLSAVGTAIFILIMTEKKRSVNKADAELALQTAIAAIDYAVFVVGTQPNFWYSDSSGRNIPDFSNNDYFVSGTHYLKDIINGGTDNIVTINKIDLGDNKERVYEATIQISEPATLKYPSLLLTIIGRIKETKSGSSVTLATRAIDAIIADATTADIALFFSDLKTLDDPGATLADRQSGILTDKVGIIEGTTIRGGIRADASYVNFWQSDGITDANASHCPKILGKSYLNQNRDDKYNSDVLDKIFPAGREVGVPSMGLPLPSVSNIATAVSQGAWTALTARIKKYSNGGIVIDQTGEYYTSSSDPNLKSASVCKIELIEEEGVPKVRITRTNRYKYTNESAQNVGIEDLFANNQFIIETTTVNLSDIKDGTIYVKGGNVQVCGALKGKLTIVADAGGRDCDTAPDPALGEPPPKEGNISVIGDLTYGNDASGNPGAIGLIAENYVYLNPYKNSNPNTLNAMGQWASVKHSVQMDWYNVTDSRYYYTSGIMDPGNRTFNFTGQMIAKYSDNEGDIDGRGFKNQNINYDDTLKTIKAPFFDCYNFQQIITSGNNLPWRVIAFFDRGSLATEAPTPATTPALNPTSIPGPSPVPSL